MAVAYVFYHYNPSLAAAAIFAALFGLTAIVHLAQLIRLRCWYFIPFVIGGVCEMTGYIGRAMSATQTPEWTSGPYIIQSLLLLVAPTLFSASIYMILGRLIRQLHAEHHCPISVQWMTKIFVASDAVSFFAQGGGGGILATAKTSDAVNTGNWVITGGLFVQLIGFGTFVIVAALFHRRIRTAPTEQSLRADLPWKRLVWVLYFVSAMILIRSTLRLIEFIQGNNGSLQSSEVWLYIFDALPMFLAVVALLVVHPGRTVKGKRQQAKPGKFDEEEHIDMVRRGGY